MRKLWITMRLMTALTTFPCIAEHAATEKPVDPTTVVEENSSFLPGEASIQSTQAAQSSTWQNWAVAGGALVAAAIGVLLVATNSGSASPHD
ncbi:MAG: hypothetical protein Q8L98_04160 [Chlamydiales bacterium]|nr:hypothetical protein [Chlamydiales bacterium]